MQKYSLFNWLRYLQIDIILLTKAFDFVGRHKSSLTEKSTINKKCDLYLSHIFNNLTAIENGGSSVYCAIFRHAVGKIMVIKP